MRMYLLPKIFRLPNFSKAQTASMSFFLGIVLASLFNIILFVTKYSSSVRSDTVVYCADTVRHRDTMTIETNPSEGRKVGNKILHPLSDSVDFDVTEACSTWSPLEEAEVQLSLSTERIATVPSTIFTVVKDCNVNDRLQQSVFVSWTIAIPGLRKIVLFSNKECTENSIQPVHGVTIVYERRVDTNPWGLPLVHSMFERMFLEEEGVTMFINSDVFLRGQLDIIFDKLSQSFNNWLAVSLRWDVETRHDCRLNNPCTPRKPVNGTGKIHDLGGVDFWAFNSNPEVPVLGGKVPQFLFARAIYDNWITHEAISWGLRDVVDISQTVCLAHISHNRDHVHTGRSKRSQFWADIRTASWEAALNTHLGLSEGSYNLGSGTTLHAPWSLFTCIVGKDHNTLKKTFCLHRRMHPPCFCEYSNSLRNAVTTRSQKETEAQRHDELAEKSRRYRETGFGGHIVQMVRDAYSLDKVLDTLDLEDDILVLSAATYQISELALSWACNLRRLTLNNFLLAALDGKMFEIGVKHGVPIFESSILDVNSTYVDEKECSFGTICFKQTTKLKSRLVYNFLRLGFSVLWSDVDIVWLKDPLKYLRRTASLSSSQILIQSNQVDATLPGNALLSANSGFYFVKQDKRTVEAFAEIIAVASLSRVSEQPHFYSVLCGKEGVLTQGEDKCVKNDLSTLFLNRDYFPNGGYNHVWNLTGPVLRGSKYFIIHNNWIKGASLKIARQMEKGLFYYNNETRACIF